MCRTAPSIVITAAFDKTLQITATIENYIRANILTRNPNSTMIVETNDPAFIIGNSKSECITFFSNQDNNAKLTQYAAHYKSK